MNLTLPSYMEPLPFELSPDRYDRLHRALLAGLLGNVGVKGDGYEYNGAKNTKFQIFPGSGLFKAKPQWVVSAEVVETTKTYARTVARIRPEWIESLAPHLVKRSWTDPRWSEPTGHVVAWEKVTLYGLTIVAKRIVHYGPIDPVLSRELFIRHALLDGELKTTADFHRHNGSMLDEIAKLEAKLRRANLLADAEVRYAFFDRLVPSGVFNAPLFDRWRKEEEKGSPRLLFWSLAEVFEAGRAAARGRFISGHLADRRPYSATRISIRTRQRRRRRDCARADLIAQSASRRAVRMARSRICGGQDTRVATLAAEDAADAVRPCSRLRERCGPRHCDQSITSFRSSMSWPVSRKAIRPADRPARFRSR